jgi:putative hydrolase of the HAD superfamily
VTTVRAVFLDVDDTLVDYDSAARASLRAVFGADADYDAFRDLGDHLERFLAGELDFPTMRQQRMADYLVAIEHPGDPVLLERDRYDGLAAHYRLFDDALPCIDGLRSRGVPIGLITNNESAHQRAKIATVGIADLFDAVVISGEFGVAKPDARIFLHACEQLDVRPDEALHVGDNQYADAEGAVAAGLRAAWLDRAGTYDGEPVDFAVIRSLDEVAGLLDR